MATHNNHNESSLGKVFAFIGILAALATGGAQQMDGGTIFLLVIIFGFSGYAIGEWVELLIVRIIFIGAAIISFLMNVAIRRFVWTILSSIFGSGE